MPDIRNRATQVRVLEEAIKWIGKRERFVDDVYIVGPGPGPEAGATCLLGGIEQAIWLATGKNVEEEEESGRWGWRRYGKQRPDPGRTDHALYNRVIARIDRAARTLYPDYVEAGASAEEITFGDATPEPGRKRSLCVLKRALADLRVEIART